MRADWMSAYNEIDVTCEQCGEEFKATVWTAVHSEQDPELKDLLLGGELNLLMCPGCSHVAYQDHFVLYQDPAAEIVAYVYPARERAQAAELYKMTLAGFREAQAVYPEKDRLPYDPLLVFGLDSLVEMLAKEKEQAEQSQIAEFLCRENHIPFTMLRPSQARRHGLVRVIPSRDSPAATDRESVLAGLDRLLRINPALSLYCDLRAEIASDALWTLKT